RERGDDLQHCRKVDGRLAAQDHDRLRAVVQRRLRSGRERERIERIASVWIPTLRARDAESAAQIATAQSDGEGGNQFEFVRDFDLRHEYARFGAGMTKPAFAREPVHAAVMRA